MSTAPVWDDLLTAPAPGQHIAMLHYVEPAFLARAVGRFAGAGLHRSEAVILGVTPEHRQPITGRLEADGLALDALSGSATIMAGRRGRSTR